MELQGEDQIRENEGTKGMLGCCFIFLAKLYMLVISFD